MANIVEVIIRAHDRTRDVFSGVSRQARSLAGNVVGGIVGAFGKLADMLPDAIGGPLKSALSTPVVGPIVIGAVVAIGAILGPLLAAILASAITLGLGGALVGVGAMILLKNKDLKEKLSKDFGEVGKTLERAFKPLTPVIEHVGTVAKQVAKVFEPFVNQAMKLVAPQLTKFLDQLGFAFTQLVPAIAPLMDAFGKILNDLGPELPGMVKQISDALIELFEAVGEDPGVITALLKVLVQDLAFLIKVVAWLTRAWSKLMDLWDGTGDAIGDIGDSLSGLWDGITSGASSAIGWVVGLGGSIKRLAGKVVKVGQTGAQAAIDWVSGLIRTIRRMVGRIVRVGQSGAQAATSFVARLISTIRRLAGKVVRIGVSGVSGAINAVARLIGWIRSLTGKVVNVGVNIVGAGKSLLGFASGGIVGAAGGGPRSNLVMVGEQGRELVRLPFGSQVIPNGQTEAMLAGQGGGAMTVQLEWVGGNAGDKLMEFLRENIRIKAGRGPNSVQKALGQ